MPGTLRSSQRPPNSEHTEAASSTGRNTPVTTTPVPSETSKKAAGKAKKETHAYMSSKRTTATQTPPRNENGRTEMIAQVTKNRAKCSQCLVPGSTEGYPNACNMK